MGTLSIVLTVATLLIQAFMIYKFVMAYYQNNIKKLIFYGVVVTVLLS